MVDLPEGIVLTHRSLSNIIYSLEVAVDTVANIDELEEGIYIFRVAKKTDKRDVVLLSCVVREEGDYLCSVHALAKENSTVGLREIAKLRPLFKFLEFRTVQYTRALGGRARTFDI